MPKMIKTIKQLLDGKVIHEYGNGEYKKLIESLLKIGFTEDYIPSYGMLKYGTFVLRQVPFDSSDIGHSDLRWLCNKIGSIHRSEKGAIRQGKLSRVTGPLYNHYNTPDSFWRKTKIWINPKTGRTYVFEFQLYS